MPADRLPWPPQSFWDRLGGPAYKYRPRLSRPRVDVRGGPVAIDFQETPLRHALAMLGRAAGVSISLDRRLPWSVAATPITLEAPCVGLEDALDLVLMQVSADGHVAYELRGDAILVRPLAGARQ